MVLPKLSHEAAVRLLNLFQKVIVLHCFTFASILALGSGLLPKEEVFFDNEGLLRLFSSGSNTLYTWDSHLNSWTEQLDLEPEVYALAYYPPRNEVYAITWAGSLLRTNLGKTPFVWEQLSDYQTDPLGLGVIDDQLIVAFGSSPVAFMEVWKLGESPELVFSQGGPRKYSVVVDATGRNIFSYSGDSLAAYDVLEEGTITYRAGYPSAPLPKPVNLSIPLRVIQGFDLLLTGAGTFFDAETMDFTGFLGNPIWDAVDMDEFLMTFGLYGSVHSSSNNQATRIQQWSLAENTVKKEVFLPGRPSRLLIEDEILYAITFLDDYPLLYRLNKALEILDAPQLPPSMQASVQLVDDPGLERLEWAVPSESADAVALIEVPAKNGAGWATVASVPASLGYYLISAEDNEIRAYRVRIAERTSFIPADLDMNQTDTARFYWERPSEVRLLDVFRRTGPDGPWLPHRQILSDDNEFIDTLEPDVNYTDYEIRYTTYETIPVAEDKVSEVNDLFFEWEVMPGALGYRLTYWDDDIQTATFVADIGADQKTFTLLAAPYERFYGRFELFAILGGNSTQWMPFRQTRTVHLDWSDSSSNGKPVLVESDYLTGNWLPLALLPSEETSFTFTFEPDFYEGYFRLQHVLSSETHVFDPGMEPHMTSTLTLPTAPWPDSPLFLYWRDATIETWQFLDTVYRSDGDQQDVYAGPYPRSYKLFQRITIPSSILGYALQPIDLTRTTDSSLFINYISETQKVQISFPTQTGLTYAIEVSRGGKPWEPASSLHQGDGQIHSLSYPLPVDDVTLLFRLIRALP
jgi:hypothetical protein